MYRFRKIAVYLTLSIVSPVFTGVVSFDSLVKDARDKDAICAAIYECVMKYNQLVLYYGDDTKPFCQAIKKAIHELITEFPKIAFVMIDVKKYPFLKTDEVPKLRFYLNATSLNLREAALDKATLKALLNQYYRHI